MTDSSPESQGLPGGDTPVFGDFWDRAARLLRPPGQPGPPPGPQQVLELAAAMRSLAATVGRYLDDARIDTGVARGNPDAWNQALATGRRAVRSAAAALDCGRCASLWPELRDGPGPIRSDSMAGRIAAAVTPLAVARDLLHTHFTTDPDGLRAEHSDWAPVIASAPVNRAVLAGLADHVRAVAQQVETMHLSSDMVGDRAHSPAGDLWRHVRRAARDLTSFSNAVQAAQWQAPVPDDDIRLLNAIPLNSAPTRTIPAASDPVPVLCAGTAGAAQRVWRTLRGGAERARWAPDLTAESMRHTAASCVVTSFNCEIILRSLAGQAEQVGYQHLVPDLNDAANHTASARHAWLAVARSWNGLTTESQGPLSPVAADAGNLALWTGRLAYADPQWTPVRGPIHAPRQPASLAADPAAFTSVVAAVHYSADTLRRIAAASQDQVLAAAGAGRLYVPVRPGAGPEHRFSRRSRRFTPAPGLRVEAVLAAYARSAEASQAVVHTAGRLAEATGAPSRVLAVAERHAELARRLSPRGQLEQVLLDRGVKDPVLLERAVAADRAARAIMADADRSQLRSQAPTRTPGHTTTREPGPAQVRPRAGTQRHADVAQVKADVTPKLQPGPEPTQADTAQLENETGAHAETAQRGASAQGPTGAGRAAHTGQAEADEPVRHAERQAEAGVEPPPGHRPAADVSPEYGAQAEAEMGEPEAGL
jgi:hypothetical protein